MTKRLMMEAAREIKELLEQGVSEASYERSDILMNLLSDEDYETYHEKSKAPRRKFESAMSRINDLLDAMLEDYPERVENTRDCARNALTEKSA
jgi:hypothetical protein